MDNSRSVSILHSIRRDPTKLSPINGQLQAFTWGFSEGVQWAMTHMMRMDNVTASYHISASDEADKLETGWMSKTINQEVKPIDANPFLWHTYGFHYEAISDQMYDTFDGKSNSYPIIHRGDIVNVDRMGTSLTIGNRPYRPPLSYFDERRPFPGDISCFLMYDRGMSPVESKLAKQRWCFHPEYAGCYKIAKSDGVKINYTYQFVISGQTMSPIACRMACHQAGSPFASVQAGKVCNCWNSLPVSSIAEASTDCTDFESGVPGEAGSKLDPTTTLSVYRSAMTRRVNGIKIYRNIHLGKISFLFLCFVQISVNFSSDCPFGWEYNSQYDICYARAPHYEFLSALDFCYKFGQSGQMAVGGSRDEAILIRFIHNSNSYCQAGCWTNDWSDPICTNHYGQLLLDYQHIQMRTPRYVGAMTRPMLLINAHLSLHELRQFHEGVPSQSICRVASPQIDGLLL